MPDALTTIRLLSGPSLVVEGAVVDRFPNRRLVALLAYLALHPDWQLRERVAEAIWPEQPEGRATASLRNALSALRRILEPNSPGDGPLIEATRTHVRLVAARCECDVWVFERAIRSHDPKAAVEAYAGDLLPDHHDEWLEGPRERLRMAFHAALAVEAERTRDPILAARWQASDPFEPRAAERLVLALAESGRASDALATLDRLDRQTREALGTPLLDVEGIRERVREVRPAPSAPPSAATPGRANPRLPPYLSRFFGRGEETEAIRVWAMGPSPLLTLLGMGGIGKTRLAVEAGRSVLAATHDVVFVPLAGADSRAAAVAAIMRAMALRESETDTAEATIRLHLARLERPTVLILDNLEHLVETIASVILSVFPANGAVKLLCTSREALGLEGESVLRLEPLRVEDEVAVRMFTDRARTTRADFALTSRNREDVTALCRELDGLPLAIEIVAAWSGAWTVAQMRENVREREVVSRRRHPDPRHRSLEACIAWSFDLLDTETQTFVVALSLFRGGWTLAAAQAVTLSPRAETLLAALVDRSLVSSAEVEGEMRFSMLETVRVYLRSKLDREAAARAAPRFVAHFERLAVECTDPGAGEREQANHRRLDREGENFEAVASLCEEGLVAIESAAAALGALHLHWAYRGQGRLGIALIERLLALPIDGIPGRGVFYAHQTAFVLARETGESGRAEEALAALRSIAEAHPDLELRFRALTQTGNHFLQIGRFAEAAEAHGQALAVAREMNLPRMDAAAHSNLAEAFLGLDRIDEAIDHWARSADLDREIGNLAGEATLYLGFALAARGDLEAGIERLGTYLHNVHGLAYGRGIFRALYYLALPMARMGQSGQARSLVATARAEVGREGYVFDAIERKSCGLVDAALDEGPSVALPLEDAIESAYRFIASSTPPESLPFSGGRVRRKGERKEA